MGIYSRGERRYYTWSADGKDPLALSVKGGLIYQNLGTARLALSSAADPEGKVAQEVAIAPDRETREVVLRPTAAGLQRIEVSDRTAGTEVRWPEGVPMTVASSPESPAALYGRWTLYFYVPKGTKVIGGYASGPGVLCDSASAKAHVFPKQPGYFSVPVRPGQDGKLWKFENSVGQRLLLTVPPYLARSPRELLLPAEVVARDAP
jgi:proteasome lid subunit RPN8/RPN11